MSEKTAKLYRLVPGALERVLPQLLGKAYEQGIRAVVLAADEPHMEMLNEVLWSNPADGFLPHASSKDPYPEQQPVYLTTAEENPNGADMLVVTAGAPEPSFAGAFSQCVELWDMAGEADAPCQQRISRYAALGFSVKAWEQNAAGGWQPISA